MTEKKKHAGGAPTKYNDEFDEQAFKLCSLGAKNPQLADFFNVCESTIDNWRNEYPEFLGAVKSGKDKFDTGRVEGALIHRALGYDHSEQKVFNNQGEILTHDVTKHYPPDTAALIFWLKNRNPDRWRDKQDINHSSEDGSMSPTKIEIVAPDAD